MMTSTRGSTMVVLGSGAGAYRGYALRSAVHAAQDRLVLLLKQPPTWQLEYVADCRVANLGDPAAVARLCASVPAAGVMTWDETLLEATARVADILGLRHMSVAAVDACRDKLATRTALAAHGLPSPQFAHVHTLTDAQVAARRIGFPVVLKPRSLAGSVGVALARVPHEMPRAFADASGASVAGLAHGDGVLVEEFLDGPEISIDSVASDGRVRPVVVARKEVGFPPYFEEIGHVVGPWRHEQWAQAVCRTVVDAHEALGIRHGSTHTEVKLTAKGPRIVEVNGRLGGDLIPHLGRLATGVDLTAAAVRLCLGTETDLRPQCQRWAAVRFLYPPEDARVTQVHVSAQAPALTWLDHVAVLALPGTELRLPPQGCVPRHAAVVVTGRSAAECADRLDQASKHVDLEYVPLGRPAGATELTEGTHA